MAMPAPLANEKKRVKVYELRENDWFDRGTGFCTGQIINVCFAPIGFRRPQRETCRKRDGLTMCFRMNQGYTSSRKTTLSACCSRPGSLRRMDIKSSKVA